MSVWTAPDQPGWLPTRSAILLDAAQRAVARTVYRLRVVLALTGGLLAALSALLLLTPVPPSLSISHEADSTAGVWARDADNPPTLALALPSLVGLPQHVSSWSRTREGRSEREDRLVAGEPDGQGPYVLAILVGRRDASAGTTSFYLDSARHAADAGLAVGRFSAIETSGFVEIARVALARTVGVGPVRNDCLAWRMGTSNPDLAVHGLACLPTSLGSETARVGCVLHDLAVSLSGEHADRLRQIAVSVETAAGPECVDRGPNPAPTVATQSRPARA